MSTRTAASSLSAMTSFLKYPHRIRSREPENVLFRRGFSAVHVDQIAHCLEGIEGDSHRKNELRAGKTGADQQILQHGKNAEVEEQAGNQKQPHPLLAGFLISLPLLAGRRFAVCRQPSRLLFLDLTNPITGYIGRKNGSPKEQKPAESGERVKHGAAQQQEHPAKAQRHEVVYKKKQR